jgi:glucose-1-phosphate thymidylyltransferase
MKGIVLAGGTGSRLWPMTRSVSKQLLPIYDKPMIYYPISTLMLAGVREILIITTKRDESAFRELLGDGSNFGITLSYAVQHEPKGLAQALIIGEEFLSGEDCIMILGDNIFHGVGLGTGLRSLLPDSGAHIFLYEVSDPKQYGILSLGNSGEPIKIIEKPTSSTSKLAITGLYYFDNKASTIAKSIPYSPRGELEITDVLSHYLQNNSLSFTQLTRGSVWLDTGTVEDLQRASSYVGIIEERTSLKIACLEEIAYKFNWISADQLHAAIERNGSNSYSHYLKNLF